MESDRIFSITISQKTTNKIVIIKLPEITEKAE